MKTNRLLTPRLGRFLAAAVAAGTLAGGFAVASPTAANASHGPVNGVITADPCNVLTDGCDDGPGPHPSDQCDVNPQLCDLTTPTPDPDDPTPEPEPEPTPDDGNHADIVKVNPHFTG